MTPEEREVFEGILPAAVLALARKGLIRESDLKNPKSLWRKVQKNIRIATTEWRISVALEHEFVEAASAYWSNDQREIAVVLFATAVEQHNNFALRMLLDAKGLEREEITKIIRSTNFAGKLTWLLRLCGESQLPDNLTSVLMRIAEIRNSIVHYKAVDAHPDKEKDSSSLIADQIAALGNIE